MTETSSGEAVPVQYNRRQALKIFAKVGAKVAGGAVLASPALKFIESFAEGKMAMGNEAKEVHNPLTLEEKTIMRDYLKPQSIVGPMRAIQSVDRKVIIDAKGNPVQKRFGVDMFGLMNTFGYDAQVGLKAVDIERADAFLLELKSMGVSYVRFLMPPTNYLGTPATPEDYKKFTELTKLLAKHDLSASIILNYWQGFGNDSVKIKPEKFSSPDFIKKQSEHLARVLRAVDPPSVLQEVHFTNELVLAEGGNMKRMMGIDTKLPDFYRMMDILRKTQNEIIPNLPLSTGFLTLMSAGVTSGMTSGTWANLVDTNPREMYEHLDTIPFVTSQGASDIQVVEAAEIPRIITDDKVPLQIGETGVYMHKNPRTPTELVVIAKKMALDATRYKPQSMALWQVIDDQAKREGFDTLTITSSELKKVLSMYAS